MYQQWSRAIAPPKSSFLPESIAAPQPAFVAAGSKLTNPPQTFYPTPPPSPDLIEAASLPNLAVPPTVSAVEATVDTARPSLSPLPISLVLSTEHQLPHASVLRLDPATSLLHVLSGTRILRLETRSVWDRMPYSAMSPSGPVTKEQLDETAVEKLLGATSLRNGAVRMPRGSKHDHIGSIFVQPPTPERGATPVPAPQPPSISITPEQPTSPTIPSILAPNGHASVPLQVLPEVRSPPRKTLAMTADSLQIAARRGRRPKIFGFTELPESSSSSANSSANNSRSNSPERHPSPLALPSVASSSTTRTPVHFTPTPPAPGLVIPRRGPVRTRSDTHLPTIAKTVAAATGPVPHHNGEASAPAPNHRRGRDNGLKLDFSGIIPVTPPADVQAAHIASPYNTKLIRKKSGELVKPALKYGGPLSASGTPLTEPSPRFESKSLPATPSCPKYVHFDAQLERVKLFNKDHKPQIVSRDGSPTQYNTSEGEEYPFPSTDEEASDKGKRVLQIRLPNFPAAHVPDSDLYLESLYLDDDRNSLRGVVVCRNFAFAKWVAVRFTFDWWQTTSEVSASHKETIKGGEFDRFAFQVKLTDMMAKIEEKTLFLCVRYNSEGREIWDSNGGSNYQVIFEKVAPAKASPSKNGEGRGKVVGGRASQWSVKGKEDDRMADLRERLSRLSADDEDAPPLSPNRDRFLSPGKRGISFGGGSPQGSPRKGAAALANEKELPVAGGALAARYDFGSAFKVTKDRSPRSQSAELPSVKTGLLSFGDASSTPPTTRRPGPGADYYSPQYSPVKLPDTKMSEHFFSPTTAKAVESPQAIDIPSMRPLAVPEVTVQGPSPPGNPSPISSRPAMARSVTSPAVIPSSLPTASRPPIPQSPSPPHLVSGSSTEISASPQSPARSIPDMSISKWTSPAKRGSVSEESNSSYSSLIEQFCWGGAGSPPSDAPRRVHSTSSLDQFFSSSPTQRGTSPIAVYDSSTPTGFTTPRAHITSRTSSPAASFVSATAASPAGSPSASSFYGGGYSFQPGTSPVKSARFHRSRDDVDVRGVEQAARAMGMGFGIGGGRGLPGHMSPPVRVGV